MIPVASYIRANYRPHFYPIRSPAGLYRPTGTMGILSARITYPIPKRRLSNHEALLDLLRASKAEKDKPVCRMTEAQHNVFKPKNTQQ
jgi:hypothetical protein